MPCAILPRSLFKGSLDPADSRGGLVLVFTGENEVESVRE